jgi:hypothetical protein
MLADGGPGGGRPGPLTAVPGRPPAAGIMPSFIGQLTDVSQCNLQEICHASTGTIQRHSLSGSLTPIMAEGPDSS